jgi:transcriptional regulator with XRE-family HTH domain
MGKAARLRPFRLGEKLRAIRLHLQLSQSELTTRLHLDGMRARHYVSQFETGQREPDLLLLLAYARAGGVSLEAILDDDLELYPPSKPKTSKRTATKTKSALAPALVFQLKITLEGVRPVVWRRVQLAADHTLQQLSLAIQIAMGWEGYHLHKFFLRDPYDGEDISETALVGDVLHEGDSFTYQYDFGDDWRHRIAVEKIVSAKKNSSYPRCVTGQRACPPEDCGGPWGYIEMMHILKNRRHRDYREWRDLAGRDFQPNAFDVQDVNQEFQINASHFARQEATG